MVRWIRGLAGCTSAASISLAIMLSSSKSGTSPVTHSAAGGSSISEGVTAGSGDGDPALRSGVDFEPRRLVLGLEVGDPFGERNRAKRLFLFAF